MNKLMGIENDKTGGVAKGICSCISIWYSILQLHYGTRSNFKIEKIQEKKLLGRPDHTLPKVREYGAPALLPTLDLLYITYT